MSKFCPFMSKDPSVLDKPKEEKHTVCCTDGCALYWKGFCSINILAQKVISDAEKEKKSITE